MTDIIPRSRGDRYALTALKKRRAEIASEIAHLKRQLRSRRDQLVHLDATLLLLDPSVEIDRLPKKRTFRHVKLFRQGELGRMILKALREAQRPASTPEIASSVLAQGGYGEEAQRTIAQRVRSNLGYLERRGKVNRLGNGRDVRWRLQ